APLLLLRGLLRQAHPTSFLVMLRNPPSPTLFPYTTLFRSLVVHDEDVLARHQLARAEVGGSTLAAARRPTGNSMMKRVPWGVPRSEEHTSELQSLTNLVCRLLLEKKNKALLHQHATSATHV